ncbi:NrfD/PsrC family molybdoenzyme membrane anchor subunit [Desulfosporosinus metallidurans]|uniref:Polysulfide reductase, subunit C n=1 Tax=Desulfosporosinus metallidurans TaxID=1888891 RepID=A0A1Q8R0W9_9FIRM|nr:NrfD/PsrC family molybdoenzyme membrane anchor subunit [Desulfosporosinus metallidurans]OLN33228.1 polysulfide reductase, subunit C [Desulfosporosinus metallidurans]
MDVTWGASVGSEIAWGGVIAIYLFLAGIAGGAFLTSALTDLLSKKRPEKVIRSGAYIAPVAIVIGLVMLIVDLGRPLTFWELLINVNFHSVMSLGVFIVSIFTAFSFAYAFLVWTAAAAQKQVLVTSAGMEMAATSSFQGLQVLRKPVALVGSLVALGTATYTGFLLSAVTTNSLWHVSFLGIQSIPFLPILFLVSALSAGLAATLIGANGNDLTLYKKTDIVLLALEMILLAILYVSVGSMYFSGSMALLFWLGVVVIGLLLPLILSIYGVSAHKNLVLPVSSMVVIGGLCLRWFVIYSGQLFK